LLNGYTQEELEAAGLDDFRVFLCEVWAFLNLPKPTRMQLNIARWLQKGPRRMILMAFRGVGKSWITVAFVLWTLLLDPQKKIMVVSANQDLANEFSKFCLQLINGMPLLQHLKPRADQRSSGIAFDVGPALPDKSPSVKSVGITGQLTGSRADLIVPDDIEVPKNTVTHLMRQRLAELVKEFDAVLKPGGRVVYLGTPQIEESLYVKLEDRGYETRIWPAEVPVSVNAYRGHLAPMVAAMIAAGVPVGTPTDTRFGVQDLMERRASYGKAGYALQFMLDTSPSDKEAHPLKLHDLIVMDFDQYMAPVQIAWGGAPQLVIENLMAGGFDGDLYHRPAWQSPEMARFSATVMAIDPSGMGKDETAYAIVKYLHGVLYVVDVGGYIDGYGEGTLKALAGKALRWGVNDIIIEENYGGGMFNRLLEPHLRAAFMEHDDRKADGRTGAAGRIDEEWNGWSSTQKEARILDTMLPVIESHRLVVSRKVIEEDIRQQHEQPYYSFIYQFTRMKREKNAIAHEDRLEAVSMACAYYTEKMNRDSKKALQQHKAAALDAELRQFKKHVFGMPKVTGPNWMN
jgi:hypothetical protein